MKKEDRTIRTTSVGGQAVMEGVMMRGASCMALAVRDEAGDIQLETYRLKTNRWYRKLPIVRGFASFLSSLVTGMKMLARSATVSSPEDEALSKKGMAVAMCIGMLLAVGLFFVLPEALAGLVRKYLLSGLDKAVSILLYSLTGGIIRIIVFILYLFLCSKLKDIRRTFMYHGAEHKTINCYEHGGDMTVMSVKNYSRIHKRCGTTFLFLVMIVSILLFSLINWLCEVYGITSESSFVSGLIRMGIKLLFLPVLAGLAYELLKLFARLPDNLFSKIVMAPGLALQKLTTLEPDDGMIEVALRSFLIVEEMEADSTLDELKFFTHRCNDVVAYFKKELAKIGAEEAEAYWILCTVTGYSRSGLRAVEVISDKDYKAAKKILTRRLEREPLDYILGHSVFYGKKLTISKDCLIPRMDTETLCEVAIHEIGKKPVHVLDLCTGSGCIALTLCNETRSHVTAADISEEALKIAAINLADKNCDIVLSDLFSNIKDRFDYIVSNPPYIRSDELKNLQPEVLCQPTLALDGGVDGLYYYREIIKSAPSHLNPKGMILLEIGYDQAKDVCALLLPRFDDIQVVKDLDGNDRVVKARLR